MELIKNYFKYLFDVILKSLISFKNNIKTQALIWVLIIVQVIGYLMIVIPMKLYGAIDTLIIEAFVAVGAMIYIPSLFFMFKTIFNFVSKNLEKDKLNNLSIIKSLLVLGLFNIVPMFIFFLIISLAIFNSPIIMYLQVIANIFTVLYYLSLFLSVSSIVYYQDKNPFFAVYQSMKITVKNILKTAPLYLFVYILGQISVILICTIVFYVAARFIPLNQFLLESFHAIVNNLGLYLIAPIYLSIQTILINDLAKGQNNE